MISTDTRKIVINGCFGGFSLSHEGCVRYAELAGIDLHWYFDEIAERVYGDEYREKSDLRHYTTAPIPGLNDGDVYGGMGDETPESKFLNDNYWSCRDLERDDPLLIQVVEELGEKANGRCAKLEVVEIPADVQWEIDEYDGNEHIAETHRTWR